MKFSQAIVCILAVIFFLPIVIYLGEKIGLTGSVLLLVLVAFAMIASPIYFGITSGVIRKWARNIGESISILIILLSIISTIALIFFLGLIFPKLSKEMKRALEED